MISLKAHNVLDYVGGGILILVPFLFGFADLDVARRFDRRCPRRRLRRRFSRGRLQVPEPARGHRLRIRICYTALSAHPGNPVKR